MGRGGAIEAQGLQKTRCAHGLIEEKVEKFPSAKMGNITSGSTSASK